MSNNPLRYVCGNCITDRRNRCVSGTREFEIPTSTTYCV